MATDLSSIRAQLKCRHSLFIISASSGVGKSTITRALAAAGLAKVLISATSRPMRGNEKQGMEYFFVSEQTFKQQIEQGLFLEWAEIYGHYYGTYLQQLQDTLHHHQNAILEIDTVGAATVKELLPQSVTIFIRAPSVATLRARLTHRNENTAEEIERRISCVEQEMQQSKWYEHTVINDDLTTAINDISAIINSYSNNKKDTTP